MATSEQLKHIRRQLEKTQAAFDRLENKDQAALIDVEAFQQHLRELYEYSHALKSAMNAVGDETNTPFEAENHQQVETSDEAEATNSSREPGEATAENENTEMSGAEASADNEQAEGTMEQEVAEATGNDEGVTNEGATSAVEVAPQEAHAEHEADDTTVKQPEKTTQQPIHEKFRGQQASLNERLQEKEKSRALADKFQLTPIADLKVAIGLNERAVFIKELFKGDKEAFYRTIEQLNHFQTYQEALAYLDGNIKQEFEWDETGKTVEHFMELIYRRFMAQ